MKFIKCCMLDLLQLNCYSVVTSHFKAHILSILRFYERYRSNVYKFNNMNDRIEHYWRTYQMINDWTKFSDTKAGIIVTVFGLFLTIIYTNSEAVYTAITASLLILILSIICCATSIISIFFAFICVNPRLKNKNTKSVFYFGHIAQNNDFSEYRNYSKTILNNENLIEDQLSEQVYVNSTIAWKKFKNVSISIRFSFATISILVLIITIYLIKL